MRAIMAMRHGKAQARHNQPDPWSVGMTIYATIQPDGTIGGLRPLPDLDLRHLYVKEDYLGERVLTIADNCTEVNLIIGIGGHHEAAVRGAMRLAAAAS